MKNLLHLVKRKSESLLVFSGKFWDATFIFQEKFLFYYAIESAEQHK